jgi:SAM-dependent methyltransferase
MVVSRFEDWTPAESTYDAVFAATAWHWVDPDCAYPKAASILRPGGALAVLTTHHVLPPDGDRFFAEIQEVYEEIGGSAGPGVVPAPDDVEDTLSAEIEASGRFDSPTTRRHLWSRTYSVDGYIDLLRTYSGHIAMTEQQRARLFDEIRVRVSARDRPVVEKHYLNIVSVAIRR